MWKLRFVCLSIEGLSYYCGEPFDAPRRKFEWAEILSVQRNVTIDVDGDADDPERFYFAFKLQFDVTNKKRLLLRCDTADERQRWLAVVDAARDEHERVRRDTMEALHLL